MATRYDLTLFEQLNEEYEDRPIVPEPPPQDHAGRTKRARRRLRAVSRSLDLNGKRVVEIGAAHGHLTRALVRRGGAREAIGVDVVESPLWERFRSRRISFHRADLATEQLLPAGSVDAVVSNAVLEHVRHPIAMIEAIARLLRVGGEAALYFNLHRGANASHRYREVYFPWPHLLFDSAVCEAFYERHHGRRETFAWVNRLTAGEYMDVFFEAGLHVEECRRHTRPIDLEFYLRFEDQLGRYPALDLETDFMSVKLRKRRRGPRRRAALGYATRQAAFERELAPLTPRSRRPAAPA